MSDNGRSTDTRRDVIVVGASAGGVEALERLVRGLSPRLAGSVLIVLHRPAGYERLMPHILTGAGALPAADARDGEPILRGRIYLAPPDRHMVIEGGLMRLVRGPKENHSRPAIDPLFRSAAQEFGPRVAGVILSGTLFDGTAGLFAVKRRGGLAIVQDPQEAASPSMPESAIGNVDIDYMLPVADIAALLSRLVGTDGAALLEPTAREPEASEGKEGETLPTVTAVEAEGARLLEEQTEALERSLWLSARLLVDKSVFLRELAENARRRGDAAAQDFDSKAALAEAHSAALRRIIKQEGAH